VRLTQTLGSTCLLFSLLAAPALAGPPLICHAVDIGSQRSLPWLPNNGWNGVDPTYDLERLSDDTVNLLAADAPITVHMETLRRAAIYSAHRPGLSDQLTIRLLGRALDTIAGERPDPTFLFDAGYFIETMREAARVYPMLHGANRDAWTVRSDSNAIDGLSLIREAARLGDDDAQAAVSTIEQARALGF
jgi:hypothetical protein